MNRLKSYTLSESVCKQLALPPVPYIHHLGRAVFPHAIPDDQRRSRSLIALGLPVFNTGLHLVMNGQGVWNYTHMKKAGA